MVSFTLRPVVTVWWGLTASGSSSSGMYGTVHMTNARSKIAASGGERDNPLRSPLPQGRMRKARAHVARYTQFDAQSSAPLVRLEAHSSESVR